MRSILVLSLICIGALSFSYPIHIHGSDEAAFELDPQNYPVLHDANSYDVAIVGGGLAGLTAALYLTERNYRVLVLEKEAVFGGLASGGATRKTIRFARGAAYFTRAYEEEFHLLKHIGLDNYETNHKIHEPSDSFFWNGKLYEGIWEKRTLRDLPTSFRVFQRELQKSDEEGLIPNQPFEEFDRNDLDLLSAEQWVRQMPFSLARRSDKKSRRLWREFRQDSRIDARDPMRDVLLLVDLYCRSALGTTSDKLSAMAFANFYISEIEPRYTSDIGTGVAAERTLKLLHRNSRSTLSASSTVTGLREKSSGVEVTYIRDGFRVETKAKYVIFSAPLKLANRIVEGLAEEDAEKSALLASLQYAHYNVHNIFVKGHPYRATYDTWTQAADYRASDFADVVLGRWMDPKIKGYEGMRNFEKDPADDNGILTVYQPLPLDVVGKGYTKEQATADAKYTVERLLELYNPLLKATWNTTIKVRSVHTNRWPFSIHVVYPGFFQSAPQILRRPLKKIFFGNNNIGTPAFEEALFRGHCAANNVLSRLDSSFVFESWTLCPKE